MKALLFSDLHYSRETKQTCFDVLRFIAKTAKQRGICVYFLGDFYDKVYKDGKLPVDLLDEMLAFFASEEWGVKTTMIPGNHDYFDSAEKIHGLSPFQYLVGFTVLDEPCLRDGQLFLPFCRTPETIRDNVKQLSPANVVFGHLDIVGARMNNTKLSTKGCGHEIFKSPTYSGHYHSRSKKGNVTYIGSPYQVHLGEAGDQKSLLVVDCTDGTIDEEIPIDIGRKHYKVKVSEIPSLTVNSGDRVIVVDDFDAIEHDPCDRIESLRDRGVLVETKPIAKVVEEKPRLELTDDEPVALWDRYLRIVGCHKSIFDMSIERVFSKDEMRQHAPSVKKQTNVCFEQIDISNFGPFHGDHTHVFTDGMTLITGKYHGKDTSDSNGVGKSLFTSGAFLWVCTGRTDPRFGAVTNVSNGIISFGKSSTYVILNGTVNGSKFNISRHMTIDGKKTTHSLNFYVDGCDVGNNTIKMTQQRINQRIFGIVGDASPASTLFDYITRTIVWTQRHCPKFLDSSDTATKNELSMIANVDYWKGVDKYVRSEHLRCKQELQRVQSLLEVYTNQLSEEERRKRALEYRILEWEAANTQKILHIQAVIDGIKLPYPVPSKIDVESKRTLVAHKQNALKELQRSASCHNFTPSDKWNTQWITTVASNDRIQQQLKKVHAADGICDACLSQITPEQVNRRKATLAAGLRPLDDLKRKREEELQAFRLRKENEIRGQIHVLEDEIKKLQRDIVSAVEMNDSANEWETLMRKRTSLEAQQVALQSATCPFDLRPQLERIQTATAKKEEYESLQRSTYNNIGLYAMLSKHTGPCGIQAYLLETTMKHLVALVHFISGSQSFQIRSLDNERLIKLFDDNPLSSMSGGEFQQLQVCCFLAYRKLICDTVGWQSNLIILDEPDVYVDATGVQNMTKIIKSIGGTSLLISHTNALSRDMTVFDTHLELERDSRGSRKRKRE